MVGFFSNEDYDDMEFDPGMFYFRQYVMMQNESIFSAVERSDLEAVRRAIESGGNVNAVQEHDGCLLEAAVTRHDGAYEDIPTGPMSVFGSAVAKSARMGRADILKILLDGGCNINPRPGRFGPPIIAAAEVGQANTVKLLIERGCDPNTYSHGMYPTALQAAAQYGSVETVRVLLDAGAKVNTTGGYFGSALKGAMKYDHKEVIKLLLDAGADPNLNT